MTMGPMGGRGGGLGRRDEEKLKAENAQAPKIPNLWPRVSQLFRPYRSAVVLTAILVVATSAATIFPPLLTQRIFDDALFPASASGTAQAPDMRLLLFLVVVILAVFLITSMLNIWQTYLTSKVGTSVSGDLRVKLFKKLQAMDLAFFTRTKTGVIQSRLQNDVGGVSGVLTTFVSQIVGNTVTVLASLVAMVLLDWRLTLLAVVLMPGLVLVQRKVGQIRARIASRTQESLSELTAITQETLSVSGILLSKVFNRQREETSRYDRENRNLISWQVKQAMSGQWFFGLVNIIMSSVPAIVYLAAGYLLTHGDAEGPRGVISAGTIVAFTTVQARLLFPLMALMRVALEVQTSRALFARIFEYLDLEPAIVDAADARVLDEHSDRIGAISFADVTFRYPGTDPAVPATLSKLTFDIEPGQKHAFVGPSGAGKTTVIYLAARLYEAQSGQIYFAGEDVTRLKQDSIIDHVGVVTQETYLFHASIAENLRYAKPSATQAELEAACRAANIHDTIAGFEAGYDTVVGERGYRLSGGEKQRLAIARVLLKDPAVLLLDEATSALDTVSEAVVQKALDTAARGRTTLVVAHRLSTIEDADVIHVLEAGRIVESGTFAELMQTNGLFARLAAQQKAM